MLNLVQHPWPNMSLPRAASDGPRILNQVQDDGGSKYSAFGHQKLAPYSRPTDPRRIIFLSRPGIHRAAKRIRSAVLPT